MSESHKCKKCNAPIYWIKMKSGKSMPVNTEYLTIVTTKGLLASGYISHFATCPAADEFREKPTRGDRYKDWEKGK